MNVFDTDLMVAVLRKNPEARQAAERYEGHDNAITSVTAMELWRGACKSERPETQRVVERILELFTTLVFDAESAKRTAWIWNHLESKGQAIDARDLMIAGTTMENDATLFTRNLKHFERIPGLKVKRW